ncbi:hypothetical protein S40293_03651 [Stachybotrys chartarum IBT 40293]|nr:hypothetical protein S40293_03651 [Stachybotrys chartarum IBT 40293]
MEPLYEAFRCQIIEQLAGILAEYSLVDFAHPILRFDVSILDGGDSDPCDGRDAATASAQPPAGQLLLSQDVKLPHNQFQHQPISAAVTSRRITRRTRRRSAATVATGAPVASVDSSPPRDRRKRQSGLRPASKKTAIIDDLECPRQMQIRDGNFPKRAKITPDGIWSIQESSISKFLVGVWQQIHSGQILEPQVLEEQYISPSSTTCNSIIAVPKSRISSNAPFKEFLAAPSTLPFPITDARHRQLSGHDAFSRSNMLCRKVTQASRTCRSIEVIVQARWTELFDSYAEYLVAMNPGLTPTKGRMMALSEACTDFQWTEKELRNKMAIWRGYKEIKDAMGWVALVFSGMGLYRLCKYRIDFDKEKMQRVRTLRPRMELAADTLHPGWRRLLALVDEPTHPAYTGHPHDWVVLLDGSNPVPLQSTYANIDPSFTFEHIEESILDSVTFGEDDPRCIPPLNAVVRASGTDICAVCGLGQSINPKLNSCKCFPNLFGGPRLPCAVQIFHSLDGRNNGLQALVPFERGVAIAEFLGLVTQGVQDEDVLDSQVHGRSYQIWQRRQGNLTRFVNHSCKPNAQFQTFTWLGTQHVLLVSKGINAYTEITVDYSKSYWSGLDKTCLCGEACCRYRTK